MNDLLWTPSPGPKGTEVGYDINICKCEMPHIGARKAGTPDRCEVCGFMTPAQYADIAKRVLWAAAKAYDESESSPGDHAAAWMRKRADDFK